jgi:MarC family membrane protein
MTAPNVAAHALKTLPMAASATFLALFPIVNPFGGVPIFFSLTSDFSPGERNHTALKTATYVTVILIFFMFLGRFVLSFFGISLPVLKIAGGLIVANTAWGMVTASSRITAAESHEASTKQDISLTPMAMPSLSGPGSIGVVMGLAANADSMVAYLGNGDCDNGHRPGGVLISSSRRSAGRAPRAGRHRSHQPHLRVFDPSYRGAVGMGRCGRLQVRNGRAETFFDKLRTAVRKLQSLRQA